MDKITSFTRYYRDKKLIDISMTEMESLIKSDDNKKIIAEYIYERLYTRYLKIFDFECSKTAKFEKKDETLTKNIFDEEFKNGFIMLASCSLLIETFAAFLSGENETPSRLSSNRFNKVFKYAVTNGNDLKKFNGSDFYKKIRCGILHQGETKGKYTVTRTKSAKLIYDNKINAYKFHKALKELLGIYRKELEQKVWDDEIWDNCRQKIRYIVNNTK